MKKVLIALVFLLVLVGCSSKTDENQEQKAPVAIEKESEEKKNEKEEPKIYGLGEPITISENEKDLYTFTVNSVTTTDERNQFSEKEVEQVVVINYSYENIADSEDVYIFSSHFTVIDEDGNVSETYPAGSEVSAQKAPIGAKSHGEESFGLISKSSKIKFFFNPSIFGDLKIPFELPVE
ncbi:membrane lipoprotein lipid attachment site-containing protein [Erysipelothrix rhusiopathiae]|uniref:membrane lipoprotein lipid attachment site-containing protein n=1 Tax=Erysipelothrix rhusiopathiae TaxID=1648 RepID=UPI0023AFC0DC|nr:membrane lipoprotein lipid attachment site-containing protein [Erysipelothrix rhusiopathiae]MDE8041787.1 membrane lipoprotein lipid attachment site-containing protein [Erysipelothrix rhusiopathiae]MDE8050298.1 membrane lipoprotein lipid attachment site-containing protein [Erysipelothrix rhusiopathiae]MDE8058056.1 membrane lipoprotein lipid attachment site-containing protein [Erysipelothrix rhusiopathiae]MDE8066987.1 membrane lipoprotein lipid attachment site-containing protein [Erysipelothri